MRAILICAVFAVTTGFAAFSAHGDLINRGNGLIYDSATNLTWLQDANFAQTAGADVDGRMFLDEAMAWVDSLNYSGLGEWRLPRNSGQVHDGVLFDTQGELASLFLSLGNVSGLPLEKTGPFDNVQADYWLANEPAPPPTVPPPLVFDGYGFSTNGGYEYPTVNLNLAAVWPVRTGDVAADFIDLVFRLPDIVVPTDGIHPVQGTISAVLELEDAFEAEPPEIAAFNVAFELDGHPAGIEFGNPGDPTSDSLIPEGTSVATASQLPHVIRFAKDALEPVEAVDGGLLVTVPFTVNAGAPSGTYPISFIAGNELVDPDAESFVIEFSGGSITVISEMALPAGDYNRNGVVDAADYVLWRNTAGQTGTGLAADGNGNGVVDTADYNLWRSNFGRSGLGGGAGTAAFTAIPEPSTCVLAAAGLGLLQWNRGRKRASKVRLRPDSLCLRA
jgi:hypothetical protein